jgi:hypothetical protein
MRNLSCNIKTLPIVLAIMLFGTLALAQHPRPQPRPNPPVQTTSADGITTFVITGEGIFPARDPFAEPPGSNFLLNVDSNMFDGNGVEMLNTLPSRPGAPYNLHDGTPIVTNIDRTSPTNDLLNVLKTVLDRAHHGVVDHASIQFGLDILEGNPIPSRPTYSGLPLLHYTGPEKLKVVDPTTRNVNIHQVWYDNHIESDTALLDVRQVSNVPWTITYIVDVLDRGSDDFSPFVMYFDDPALSPPGMPPMPHVAMDQTFFPMQDGTRTVFTIKMAPGKYYNLTYTWGWRIHPPRVQVSENAFKVVGGKTLIQWEIDTFGPAPRSSETAKLAAIAQIGELAPEKRIWQALRDAKTATAWQTAALMEDALVSFDDWRDRNKLPRGVQADPNSDITLFYANNTIYGSGVNGVQDFPKWKIRPQLFKATLLNGDHFVHSYMNVDFGGARGWENQFQSTTAVGGSGCWFTFGRTHWWVNAGGPFGLINVPPVVNGTPGLHKVEITLNFEPSRRLRLYQFDPLHHDVAVYSLH